MNAALFATALRAILRSLAVAMRVDDRPAQREALSMFRDAQRRLRDARHGTDRRGGVRPAVPLPLDHPLRDRIACHLPGARGRS